jgi:EmrB/QacA subfamily drug resistance transporter
MRSNSQPHNAPRPEQKASGKWWSLLGIGLGLLMFSLDTSIVNIALPTLVQTLHTNFATIQWVVLSYQLIIATLVLGAARLGDMFGKKRLYLGGMVVFTISSLLCGLSPSVGWLIGFRALQGLGAVFISALALAIITEVFPDSERGRAVGIACAILPLGFALGPSVGGLLIGFSSWRTIFLVNVPISIVASFIVARVVPPSFSTKVKQRFDGLGALMMTVTLVSFALGMTYGQNRGFGSGTTLTLLAVAVISLVCFLGIEARIQQPLLDLRIFRNLQLTLSLSVALLVFIVFAGAIFLIPFFLGLVLHYPTQQVGLLLAVIPILGGITALISGTLSDRIGLYTISLSGLLLMMVGYLLLATVDAQLTNLGFVLRVAALALGVGMFQAPNNSAIMGAIPREMLGIASGLLSLSRTLGYTAGVPLTGTLFATLTLTKVRLPQIVDVTDAPAFALMYGVQRTFLVAAIINNQGKLLSLLLTNWKWLKFLNSH